MVTTNDSFLATDVSWVTPAEILSAGYTTWNYIRVYRSSSENSGYQLVQTYDLSTAVTCTFSIAPANTVNKIAHGFVNGDLVGFSTTGTLPSTLTISTLYYVVNKTDDTFQVALVPSGTALSFSSAGTGTNQVYKGLTKSQIASQITGTWVTTWTDTTASLDIKDAYYYLIRYYNSTTDTESKFYLTFKALTPREQRLINMLKGWITPWMSACVTDDDLRAGLVLGLNAINIYPPLTTFDMNTCPKELEPLWITGSAIFTLMYRYLGVAFTDVSYTDNGLTLTLDRGGKVKQATDTALAYYNQLLALAKLEYSYGGSGVGTISMPLSLGGKMSANLLNVLDMFQATGR
jgi:hypothetical protein